MFLDNWGVRKRTSSAYYPQSNGRAELAVKTAKRILTAPTAPTGQLSIDSAARAMMRPRNTPVQDIGMSPSEMLFGRNLNAHLPSAPYQIRKEWSQIADAREQALGKRHIRNTKRYNEHTRALQPLAIGDKVAIQNQHGTNPLRWQKTGTIVATDTLNRQYEIKVDGSRWVTRRNRRFVC